MVFGWNRKWKRKESKAKGREEEEEEGKEDRRGWKYEILIEWSRT